MSRTTRFQIFVVLRLPTFDFATLPIQYYPPTSSKLFLQSCATVIIYSPEIDNNVEISSRKFEVSLNLNMALAAIMTGEQLVFSQ